MQLLPPAGSPHRRDTPPPPPPLSPPSRGAFPATADGDHGAAVSEHPGVKLFEWWLATVEGDDQKIAVAGSYERNYTVQELSPAPIAKRHSPSVLETEDGVVLLISGSLNVARTLGYGYSTKVCENFAVGFPHWWQNCNLIYPKLTSSHTGCRPFSSYTGNSTVDSTQFYLEKFQQGNRLHLHGTALFNELRDIFKSSSQSDAPFQKSSHLSNGAPRFEEHTCDGDNATNENTAAPGDVTERHEAATDGTTILEEHTCNGNIPTNEDTAASNDDNERHRALSKEGNNVEIGLIAGSTSIERGHDDIATNVSLAPTVECTPATGRKKPPVASLKSQGCGGKNQHIASNKKPVGRPKKQRSPPEKRQSPRRSPVTSPVLYASRSPFARGKAMSTPEALKLKRTRSGRVIVPTLDPVHTCNGDIPTNEDTAVSNDDNERHRALSKEANNVEIGLITGSTSIERGHDDIATNVSLAPTMECTPATDCQKNAASNDDNERCTSLPKEVNNIEIGLIKGSTSIERGHIDIATNASLAPTVECTPATGRKKPPVASLKSQGCGEKNQHIASNKKPVGRPKKQRSPPEKRQSPRRSPVTSPVLYASWSPFARGKAMSTPEALKLKRTRSGRVIVPTLDPGCQSIVYDQDGSISGVIGLDSPATKGGRVKS